MEKKINGYYSLVNIYLIIRVAIPIGITINQNQNA